MRDKEPKIPMPKGNAVRALGGWNQHPGHQTPEPPVARKRRLLAIVRKRKPSGQV